LFIIIDHSKNDITVIESGGMMKKCLKCQSDMVEGLNILSTMGSELQLANRFPKGQMNKVKVKVYVCPQCGYIELYTEDLENLKHLTK